MLTTARSPSTDSFQVVNIDSGSSSPEPEEQPDPVPTSAQQQQQQQQQARLAEMPTEVPTPQPAPSSGASAPAAPADAAGAAPTEASVFGGLFGGLFGGASEDARQGEAAAEPSGQDAVAEFEHAVEELGKKTAEVVQGISSWFQALETSITGEGSPAEGAGAKGDASKAADTDEQLLGLEAGEAVLESFACQLLQTYTCTSNFFTPVRTIPFRGQLHITSARVCFVFEPTEGASSIAPVKVPVGGVRGVSKQPAAEALPERLVVDLRQGGSLALGHFALKELEMDSALALLEHLAEPE
eukprot:scaffold15.g4272.t1